ncbi:threonine aldolase [Variovorax sp. TBS-050B]|uniref:threonine aldolase family protein n=1 Tax=Variovorax sp. TBS-050B TaxID=2940551 RepID=UPI0024740A44|nr:GntG family PLP-dependent aldolase [Variovorax sp. TBS-050B]MDH6591470.1 threonine aldolase [Variovorax sp. TBS-050B]
MNPHEPSLQALDAVDLRSDTVTRPTDAMFERARSTPLGDDGLDGDPTARELEAFAAAELGKEAGLFVPTCTMGNLLAVLAQVPRNGQVVTEANAHMITAERGSATFSGAFYVGIPGADGAMDPNLLEDTLAAGGHRLRTALVAMETSHNNAGGAVLPLAHMAQVYEMARRHGAAVHLDGARLYNAAVALGAAPARVAQHVDSVSLCLSKGLSAPAGAVLVGDRAMVQRARTLRRMLGGTQRQIGVLAAFGLEALQTMGARLAEDHARAARLGEGLRALGATLQVVRPMTNIVLVDVSATGRSSADWVAALEAAGLRVRPWGPRALRCVTHRHIDDAAITRAVQAFVRVLAG